MYKWGDGEAVGGMIGARGHGIEDTVTVGVNASGLTDGFDDRDMVIDHGRLGLARIPIEQCLAARLVVHSQLLPVVVSICVTKLARDVTLTCFMILLRSCSAMK